MKIPPLLIAALLVTSLHGQEDPFTKNKVKPAEVETIASESPKNISICYETFSMPLAQAAKLQRERLADSDLYARLVAAVEKQTARQETFTMLRSRSGQKATTESISEQIYATEYEPPRMPATVGVAITPPKAEAMPTSASDGQKPKEASDPKTLEGLKTPALPSDFETRNTGVTLEIEPTLDETAKLLGLRVAPQHIALVGHSTHGQGLSMTEMPIFEVQRLNTEANLHINQPYLLGTVNRPPSSTVDPDSANRVWFAFLTGKIAKP